MTSRAGDTVEQLFDLLKNTADGAFVIDDEQRIVFWNDAARQMLGYTPEEVIGRPCYEILGGCDERGRVFCCPRCYVAAAASAGKTIPTYDIAIRTKSGDLRWINISILTLRGPASSVLIVHLFRDTTPHKKREQFILQLLEQAERLQAASFTPIPPPSPAAPAANLTGREMEILSLLAQGLSTGDIADTLSISLSTTRNHIQNILSKLGVHSRLEAVAYAFEHGLVNRPPRIKDEGGGMREEGEY